MCKNFQVPTAPKSKSTFLYIEKTKREKGEKKKRQLPFIIMCTHDKHLFAMRMRLCQSHTHCDTHTFMHSHSSILQLRQNTDMSERTHSLSFHSFSTLTQCKDQPSRSF